MIYGGSKIAIVIAKMLSVIVEADSTLRAQLLWP